MIQIFRITFSKTIRLTGRVSFFSRITKFHDFTKKPIKNSLSFQGGLCGVFVVTFVWYASDTRIITAVYYCTSCDKRNASM
jgi:hypothetical protein